ncbi:hypothetical protein [Halopiger goleimassiliensis]|uniref:hypothetical protein n=1 Tax=Halopiger goleimassiliensis TaxID=1293048 RepID=UPI00067830B6|nr:hypothetical protein [Halopiger goleimassiliensis]
MTDSTSDEKSTDGGVEVGSSAEELFGGIDEGPFETDVERGDDADDRGEEPDEDDGIEDQTAASVFGQLKDDVESDDTDELLEDESPEDIIASADEPEPELDPIDEDLRADEEELADLLLTGRTKGEEFLWIDPADESNDAADDTDTTTATDVFGGNETPKGATDDDVANVFGDDEDGWTGSSDSDTADETDSNTDRIADNDRAPDLPMPGDEADDETGETDVEANDEADDGDVGLDLGRLESDTDSASPEDTGSATVDDPTDDTTGGESDALDSGTGADADTGTDDTGDADDDSSPGFLRRLLGKLFPF